MSDGFTGLLFGIGFGGWVYYKLARTTGGNTKNSLTGGIIAGVVGFFVIFSLLKIVLHV